MDLRGLQYFAKIAELGSITRAAYHLHVAQPALSRQVQQLEDHLGAQLLVRESRGVRLTDPGRLLLDHALKILRDVERAQDDVRGSAGKPRGRVGLGLVPTICPLLAPALVSALRQEQPGIELTITESYSAPLLDQLVDGRIDLAVVTEPAPTRKVAAEPLVIEEMTFAVRKGTRKPGPISAEELGRTPVILSQGLRTIMELLFSNEGPALNVMLQLDSIETIRLMVREGVGPAILPRSILRTDAERGALTLHGIGPTGLFRSMVLTHARARRLSMASTVVKESIARLMREMDDCHVFRLAREVDGSYGGGAR